MPAPDPGSKYVWGPRVWRLLHLLAEISDRRDVCFLWKNVLRSTASVLPCEKCRRHFNEFLNTHSVLSFSNILHITGNDVRTAIVNTLFDFHNAVNIRLGKPPFTQANYDEIYLQHREIKLLEAQKLFNEIKASWTPLVHTRVNGSAFAQWKHTLSLLFALVSVGPLL